MSRITHLRINPLKQGEEESVHIRIDNQECLDIPLRIFERLNLKLGDDITCDELKRKRSLYWKENYGVPSWVNAISRMAKIAAFIESLDQQIEVHIAGFGAATCELIDGHPTEAGEPDLNIRLKPDPAAELLFVETTGTDQPRGDPIEHWITKHKVEYAQAHPEKDIWFILRYEKPKERLVFIKIALHKDYEACDDKIRGKTERMVHFKDDAPEVRTQGEFAQHLYKKLGHEFSS